VNINTNLMAYYLDMAIKNIGIIQGFVGGGGGTDKTLKGIIDTLTENYNVTLYTFSKPLITFKDVKIKSMIPFHFPIFGIYQRLKESKLIDRAKDEDIIFQTSGSLAIPRNSKQKLVIYCHNDFSSELEKTATKYKGVWLLYYKPYYKKIEGFLEKIHEKNILLISNSQFTQESIKKKYNKQSTVIFPPVDLSEFKSNLNKEKSVITVSRYSEEKNLDFAIKVMKKVQCDYQIFGNTNTKSNVLYYRHLLSESKELTPKSKIHLNKNETRKNILDNFKKSKVYFHPAPETFGITIIEGIAAGCIPIVPDNSAHCETVTISELRYKPYDIDDAQNKIERALSGEFDHHIKTLQSSLNKYDKETFKQKIIEFLKKLE